MKISRKDNDALNALLTINIDRKDFAEKVEVVLSDYRKKANIPGFRKGHVPMGLIKKQYETSVTAEEVNKLLQENLEKYLKDEKIEILGNPLPVMKEVLDWTAECLSFDFELGLSPVFEVDLSGKNKIAHYLIKADDKMINEQLIHYQKQHGKLISQENPKDDSEISAVLKNKAAKIEVTATFDLTQITGKSNLEELKKATVGSKLSLAFKKLFKEDATALRILGITEDKLKEIKDDILIEIKEINKRELAELNQELFDKLFGPDTVKSEAEMKEKIQEGIEKQFQQQSEQKLLNDVTEYLIDNTSFDLPTEFLKKWMQNSGKEPLTEIQAEEEYERSEKGIRYQLIEGKLIIKHDLQVKFEALKDYAKEMITLQMAQYGQPAPPDEELEGIVTRVMSNQEETKRMSDQLMSNKLLDFFKINAPLKEKKVTFDAFVKEAYGKA